MLQASPFEVDDFQLLPAFIYAFILTSIRPLPSSFSCGIHDWKKRSPEVLI